MSFSTNSSWGPLFFKGKPVALAVVVVTLLILCLTSWAEHPVSSVQRRALRRATETTEASATTIWQPKTGIKWQIQLENAVEDTSMDADIFDIDMFDNTAAKISEIHKKGAKVICYFSAGTYENWRPDANRFTESDFGSALPDWPGERWLNLLSNNVRQIMQDRLDLAK